MRTPLNPNFSIKKERQMKKVFYGSLILVVFGIGFVCGAFQDRIFTPTPVLAEGARMKISWQELDSNINRTLHRTPVPGGWIVAQQNGLAFVPDPDGKWQ
jgi:hypothetical protein